MAIAGLILLVGFLLINYINAPKLLGLSKENPKVKTGRRLLMVIMIFSIGRFLILELGLDKVFSPEVNDRITVIVNALIIMYFGNILPKLQVYKDIDVKKPWAGGDEKVWKKASKVFAYLSFVIGILMIILSFFFDSMKVRTVCHLIWFGIPLLYILFYYNKKFGNTNTQ